MTYITYFSSSNNNLNLDNLSFDDNVIEDNLDQVRVVYEYLFVSTQSLKQKNKYLLKFIHDLIPVNSATIDRFLKDEAIIDLDISLLKSILIMTNNVECLVESRKKVEFIYNEKFKQLI